MKKNILILAIMLMLVAIYLNSGCKTGALPDVYEPDYQAPQLISPLVASYHDAAANAGYRIMNAGGNAYDAFVAVTLVENVLSPGYVTMAGLLSVLMFDASANEVMCLDAGFNSVSDPGGAYDAANPIAGKTVAVPGLIRGLESLQNRYGRLSWAECVQPALELARDGFPVDQYWAYVLEVEKEVLQRSEYGRNTFYPGGQALQLGEILRQPEVAEFLTRLADQGADYMYTGLWAQECTMLVRSQGGLMTMEDMASYQPTWTEPWRMPYRGFDICATSGRSMYALKALLCLKTLEHTTINQLGHFSASADALEIIVRVIRAVEEEYWITDYNYLDNRPLVESRLTLEYTRRIWSRVQGGGSTAAYNVPPPEPHTLTSVVADTDGNVISGKHSINSWYFGVGFFVQGIPLNGTCELTYRYTGPGGRRTQGAPNMLVFKDGRLRYSVGTYGGSNPQTAFQFLVNVLDYGLSPEDAASLPRVGGFAYNYDINQHELNKNYLDQRVSQEIIDILASRGLYFMKRRRIGPGAVVEFHTGGATSVGWD